LTPEGRRGEAFSGLVVKDPFPSALVDEVLSASPRAMRLLGFTSEQASGLADGWRAVALPAGAYPGLERDTLTAAETKLLVVDAETANVVVYEVTKAIFDSLLFLANFHDVARRIKIDRALQGSDLPLHPGAGRYFHEVGLLTETVVAAVGIGADSAVLLTDDASVIGTRSLAGSGVDRQQSSAKGRSAAIFNFYFDLGETELSPAEITKLQDVAREIRIQSGAAGTEPKVTVVGATYTAGSRETYQEVAVRRAKSVEAALIAEGLPPSSSAVAEKEWIRSDQTVGANADQSQMRRVEVQVETPIL
jgi:outer membrane protein OmpA-like peptidoglycan-associated protein